MLVNDRTTSLITLYTTQPSQACIIKGPVGSGKQRIAKQIAEKIVGVPYDKGLNTQYFEVIREEDKSLSLDLIREVKKQTSRSAVGINEISRIVIVHDMDYATEEAQNALLKTLEEQPKGTLFLLTASDVSKLLDTIRSRCFELPVLPIEESKIREHYKSTSNLDRYIALSGGRAELLDDLISGNSDELDTSIKTAKSLLAESSGKRLLEVERLSKSKQDSALILTAFELIAESALKASTQNTKQFNKWLHILEQTLATKQNIEQGGNLKLHLTSLFISL